MTARKYVTWEECVARGWYSRTWWKSKGIAIPEDAQPRDHAWKPAQRKSYPVFSEDQGTPILKKGKLPPVLPDTGDLFGEQLP